MNVDLTRAIARATGMEIEFRLGPWPHVVAALERGEIDALQGMYYSTERARKFDFSQPYLTSHYVSVVRKGDRQPPATLKELKGLSLAAQKGDIIHDHLIEHGLGDRLILFEDQESVLKAVAEGRADCALAIRVIALRALQTGGLTNLELGSRTFLAMDYCYAVRKGNKALLAHIMEGLQFVEESGEYRRITDKWLGVYDRSELAQRAIRIALWIAVPLAIALAGVFLWTTQLRRRVAARTRELRESESNYRLLIENVHEIIFTLAPDGTVTFISPSWSKLLGHPIEETVGGKFQPFVHPDDLPVCTAVLQKVIETGGDVDGISYRVQHANGTWRRLSSHVVPLKNENGAIIGIEGLATDITGQKEAEENYQMLFNKMFSGFALHEMIYDEAGHPSDYRFIRVNPAFERMTGLSAGDIEGKCALEILPKTEKYWIETYGNVATTGEPAFFENYSAEMGKWFEVAAFRPAPNQFACVFSDTTQRKQAEARIEHLNRVLRAIRDVNQLIVREHSRSALIREACRLMVDHRGYRSALVVLTNASGDIEEWAAAGLANQSEAFREMLDRGQKPPCCDPAQADSEGLLVADRKRICLPCPFLDPCGDALSMSIRLVHGGGRVGMARGGSGNHPRHQRGGERSAAGSGGRSRVCVAQHSNGGGQDGSRTAAGEAVGAIEPGAENGVDRTVGRGSGP